MPLPKPNNSESKEDFISRCMGDEVMNEEYESEQRLAVCNSIWEDPHKDFTETILVKSAEGEYEKKTFTQSELCDFFTKNIDEEGYVQNDVICFKSLEIETKDDSIEFVMSDGSLDRSFERVDPDGWDLKTYRKNPVVLWAHDQSRPAIGRMKNVAVKDGQLKGKVEFVPRDVDAWAWSIGERVRLGFLQAGSVGYKPTRVEVVENAKDGTRLIHREQILYEFSIVNIPALSTATVAHKENEAQDNIEEEFFLEKNDFIDSLFEDTDQETSGLNSLFGSEEGEN